MGSLETNETWCKGGDPNSLCNNCSEIYIQMNVNTSLVGDSGHKPDEDCLTYFYPHFKWHLCSRTDAIRSMCSNSTYKDHIASAKTTNYSTSAWSAGNKVCLAIGQLPSFERSITNAGFGKAQAHFYWTGIFRANILIKLSLKDVFSPLTNDICVYVKRRSNIVYFANNGDTKRALCVTGTGSTSRHQETSKYTTEVQPSITTSTYSKTILLITKVTTPEVTTADDDLSRLTTTHMQSTLATEYAFPTSSDGIPEEHRGAYSEKSLTLALGIGVSVCILCLVGGAVVFVVLKRRRVLLCCVIKAAEGQSRRRFEEKKETNYEGMIDRNENNDSYCALGDNVVPDEETVSYISPQSDLNGTEDKYRSEYYTMDSYEYVKKGRPESDLMNK
ncbi:uncharacterized protein LOC127831672 [Dreissena polymorpha]|uniref:uncharacterized protein LOC127831672 n=1 Tax=Dreissena polymorpha TaxID=45954 RepID=UPI002263E625|nr:uncharacterized protein LOC127831672 [Dreissena polymorpha]XP_052212651.1 uncharacterized protein LOC127831672 [Dreissena polymorpha]